MFYPIRYREETWESEKFQHHDTWCLRKGSERLGQIQSTQNKSHGMFQHLSGFFKSKLTSFIMSYHVSQKLHHSLFLFCHIVICVLLIKTSRIKTLGSYCQGIQHSIRQITNTFCMPTHRPVFALCFWEKYKNIRHSYHPKRTDDLVGKMR